MQDQGGKGAFFVIKIKNFTKKGCKIIVSVIHYRNVCGRMVEWFKAAVLKTAEGQLSEGSNPSSSAIFFALFQAVDKNHCKNNKTQDRK